MTANLPTKGEYGIEVYGNDPAKDGDTYTHICQYYVHFADPREQEQAFYQDSPERRTAMGGPEGTMVVPGRYDPGSSTYGVRGFYHLIFYFWSGKWVEIIALWLNQNVIHCPELSWQTAAHPPTPRVFGIQYYFHSVVLIVFSLMKGST